MPPLTFKTVWRNDGHNWSSDGEKITDGHKLETIRQVLEETGGRAPDRLVFDDYDDFIEYLQQHAKAGDAIHIWDLHPLLRGDNELVHGKCPAEDGTVPKGGAY
jgi:hypothetical protein